MWYTKKILIAWSVNKTFADVCKSERQLKTVKLYKGVLMPSESRRGLVCHCPKSTQDFANTLLYLSLVFLCSPLHLIDVPGCSVPTACCNSVVGLHWGLPLVIAHQWRQHLVHILSDVMVMGPLKCIDSCSLTDIRYWPRCHTTPPATAS